MLANRLVRACESLFSLPSNDQHAESCVKRIPARRTTAHGSHAIFFASLKDSGEQGENRARSEFDQNPRGRARQTVSERTNSLQNSADHAFCWLFPPSSTAPDDHPEGRRRCPGIGFAGSGLSRNGQKCLPHRSM